VQIYNNVIWMDDPSQPIFQWNNYDSFIGTAGLNLLPTNWGTNNQAGARVQAGETPVAALDMNTKVPAILPVICMDSPARIF